MKHLLHLFALLISAGVLQAMPNLPVSRTRSLVNSSLTAGAEQRTLVGGTAVASPQTVVPFLLFFTYSINGPPVSTYIGTAIALNRHWVIFIALDVDNAAANNGVTIGSNYKDLKFTSNKFSASDVGIVHSVLGEPVIFTDMTVAVGGASLNTVVMCKICPAVPGDVFPVLSNTPIQPGTALTLYGWDSGVVKTVSLLSKADAVCSTVTFSFLTTPRETCVQPLEGALVTDDTLDSPFSNVVMATNNVLAGLLLDIDFDNGAYGLIIDIAKIATRINETMYPFLLG